MFKDKIEAIVTSATGAAKVIEGETIQQLWSGYGNIIRYQLEGSTYQSVIVKHVHMPTNDHHPRGWNTDRSHQRKLKSYQVETSWYKDWSKYCDDDCKVPDCLAVETFNDEVAIVLEDLDAAGYPVRKASVSWDELIQCLKWLANFHATFLGEMPKELWDIGTYWHLDTRPDELEALDDLELKKVAVEIDEKLNGAEFQTFVHGDAKLANFCFSKDGQQVAAVDFQYVGGGCGMKDVAYFIGSCMYEEDCERLEDEVLDYYFSSLKVAISNRNTEVDFNSLEQEWRSLYPVAWTDFHRFLKGWSPGHWKINSYSERIAHEVVENIDTGNL